MEDSVETRFLHREFQLCPTQRLPGHCGGKRFKDFLGDGAVEVLPIRIPSKLSLAMELVRFTNAYTFLLPLKSVGKYKSL